MVDCTSCGYANDDSAKFCKGCGNALAAKGLKPTGPAQDPESVSNLTLWIWSAVGSSMLAACVFAYQQASADWFVPVGIDNPSLIGASGAIEGAQQCGYVTFGGETVPIPRATKTGHFDSGGAKIGNDQGWVTLRDRRGLVDTFRDPGAPDYVTLKNVAYNAPPLLPAIYSEWELSPFSAYAAPVFITGDGLQASTFGTHYPGEKSDIDGEPERFFNNGLYGYKKGDGTDAISARYERASHFSSESSTSVAAVNQNRKWGFIGPTGQIVRSFEYEDVQVGRRFPGNDHYWTVKKDGRWGLLQTETKNPDFRNMTAEQFGKLTPEQKAKNVQLNTTFKMVISPRYDYALPYIADRQNGTLIAKNKSGWAFYDINGALKSEQYYSDISMPVEIETPGIFQSLAGGFFLTRSNVSTKMNVIGVEVDGAWGFVDIDGDYLVEPRFGRPCGHVSINESIGE